MTLCDPLTRSDVVTGIDLDSLVLVLGDILSWLKCLLLALADWGCIWNDS